MVIPTMNCSDAFAPLQDAIFTASTGALNCKKGGFVLLRQYEIRYCIGDVASQARPQVINDPVVN